MNWVVSGGGMGTRPHSMGGGGCMHPGVVPTFWGLHQGGSGGATRPRQGRPRCVLSPLDLAVPRGVSEVRLVAVWVGWRAPGRGDVGIVCHGNPWVVLVPLLGVGQERGRGVAVTRVGPLVLVGTATPYRWAVVAVPRAVPARQGSVRATRAVTPLVLGLRLPVGVGGPGEVHFVLRDMLAPVFLSSSSTVGFASGVLPIGV